MKSTPKVNIRSVSFARDPFTEAASELFGWQVREYFGVLIFEPVAVKDQGCKLVLPARRAPGHAIIMCQVPYVIARTRVCPSPSPPPAFNVPII